MVSISAFLCAVEKLSCRMKLVDFVFVCNPDYINFSFERHSCITQENCID